MATKNKSRKRRKKGNAKVTALLLGGVLCSVLLAPTTVLLAIGMLPTPFAMMIDKTRQKARAISVGALNLAGCVPFLLQLWTTEHSIGKALSIVTDPTAIVVMYSAAAAGYMVDWAMTGIVSNILYQRGQGRQKTIKKRQAELIERWGREVTGDIPLGPDGMPLSPEPAPEKKDKKQED